MACLTAAWSTSLACMIIGTVTQTAAWRGWGIWLALVGCCFTGWGIVDYVSRRQRLRMEELATIMAAEAARHYNETPHLTSVR